MARILENLAHSEQLGFQSQIATNPRFDRFNVEPDYPEKLDSLIINDLNPREASLWKRLWSKQLFLYRKKEGRDLFMTNEYGCHL